MVLHRSNAMSVGILESEKLIAADVSAQLRISPFLPFRVDWPDETAFLVGLRVHNNIYHYGQFPPRNPLQESLQTWSEFSVHQQGYWCYRRKRTFLEKNRPPCSALKKTRGIPSFLHVITNVPYIYCPIGCQQITDRQLGPTGYPNKRRGNRSSYKFPRLRSPA